MDKNIKTLATDIPHINWMCEASISKRILLEVLEDPNTPDAAPEMKRRLMDIPNALLSFHALLQLAKTKKARIQYTPFDYKLLAAIAETEYGKAAKLTFAIVPPEASYNTGRQRKK